MDTKHEIPYLSEEQLASLIEQIEQTDGECVPAPKMLEQQVFGKICEKEQVDSMEERKRRKQKELRGYTLRVAFSAAASIAVLLAFSAVQQKTMILPETGSQQVWQEREDVQEKQLEQQKEYEKEKEAWVNREEKRKEAFETRGEEKDTILDGLGNIISEMRRKTK